MKHYFKKSTPLGLVFILALIVIIETGLLIGEYIYYQTLDQLNNQKLPVLKTTIKPALNSAPVKLSGWKAYSNAIYDFQIKYPPDWSYSNQGNNIIRFFKGTRRITDTQLKTYLSFEIFHNTKNLTLGEWLLEKYPKDNLEPSMKLFNLGDNPAYIITGKNSRPEIITAIAEADGEFIQITKVMMDDNSEETKQIFNDIISSFQFTGQNLKNLSPTPSSNIIWTIDCVDCDKFLSFLVTDPDGNQTGYLPVVKKYIKNIPGTSYGTQPGIAPSEGNGPRMSNMIYFASGMENKSLKKGVYTVEVDGYAAGDYYLEMRISGGSIKNKDINILGKALPGSSDKYSIDIPIGTYTKITQ